MFSRKFQVSLFLLLLQFPVSIWAELPNYSIELKQQLLDALKSQAAGYKPNTQHICENNLPCYTNRLILENSPYLLQHAHNPVDWYSWNKQALDKAKRENKPIFLSIGYAACHWCHVMEKQSFDNIEISRLLNAHFISIKVDRELRPDIDEFYANAVMAFQGQQGWPMSVFLTPDGKPFFAGGFYNRSEFKILLNEMSTYWKNEPKQAMQKAENIINEMHYRKQKLDQVSKIDAAVRYKAIKDLYSIIDNYNGGFGEGSKFPREPWLLLLLDESYGKSFDDDSSLALHMTLRHMANGGIYDQLAGGFHRYTTDPYWKIPHFEKMLYNQALLLQVYLRANAIQPNQQYTRVIRESIDFLLSEMRDSKGGFYSALDADTEGEEGRFYLWYQKEWEKVLSKNDSNIASTIFDVDEYGETEDGGNVLYMSTSLDEYAAENNISINKLKIKLDQIRKTLLKVRNQRFKPEIDKKIIMGWNGLVITALAESSLQFKKSQYLQAAIEAANFIWNELRGRSYFYRVNYKGNKLQAAQLDDYAFYLHALITLYDIDENEIWLERAKVVVDLMIVNLWDEINGGFFNVPLDKHAPLPMRPKSAFDKTLPSGNSVAASMLVRLARRTGDDQYTIKANQIFSAFTSDVIETPSAFSGLLVATNELQQGEKDLPVYAAGGHIRIDACLNRVSDKQYDLTIDMKIDEKWHINSHKPFDKKLIPTVIALEKQQEWHLLSVQYPEHDVVKLGISDRSLSLYQGHKLITSRISKDTSKTNPVVSLQLQACDDSVCLPPEKFRLYPRLVINDQ